MSPTTSVTLRPNLGEAYCAQRAIRSPSKEPGFAFASTREKRPAANHVRAGSDSTTRSAAEVQLKIRTYSRQRLTMLAIAGRLEAIHWPGACLAVLQGIASPAIT